MRFFIHTRIDRKEKYSILSKDEPIVANTFYYELETKIIYTEKYFWQIYTQAIIRFWKAQVRRVKLESKWKIEIMHENIWCQIGSLWIESKRHQSSFFHQNVSCETAWWWYTAWLQNKKDTKPKLNINNMNNSSNI